MEKNMNELKGMVSRVKPALKGLLITVAATAIVTTQKPRQCAGLSFL